MTDVAPAPRGVVLQTSCTVEYEAPRERLSECHFAAALGDCEMVVTVGGRRVQNVVEVLYMPPPPRPEQVRYVMLWQFTCQDPYTTDLTRSGWVWCTRHSACFQLQLAVYPADDVRCVRVIR